MTALKTTVLAAALTFGALIDSVGAGSGWQELAGQVPPGVTPLAARGRVPGTNALALAISLPLRNEAALDECLRQLYDPASTNFHKFLTPAEFTDRFGPAAADYDAVRQFAAQNGLAVAATYPNRLVLDVSGSAAAVEKAFRVTLRTYRHPTEPREFFAPDAAPSVPAGLKVLAVEGLNNFSLPRRAVQKASVATRRPLSFSGSGPNSEYMGRDFRNAYVPGSALNGAGQTLALLEYSDYYPIDVTNYENLVGAALGATNYVPLTNVVVGGSMPAPSGSGDQEASLDIEMAVAMAPNLARVIVYEKSSSSSSLLNRIASDNLAKQVSSSWMVGPWSVSTANAYDNILKTMAAQGQSYFQSAGDADAYTGKQPLDSGTTVPADSPYATIVGGTTLTMSGAGQSWNAEAVWNYNLDGEPNLGSGGGISPHYPQPVWQTNFATAANSGSPTNRNIPDVALTADDIFCCYGNGNTSGSEYFMGTSAAAPLWAGFCALANQMSVATNGAPLGFLNPALYHLAVSSGYSQGFHDITAGNNVGTNTAGLFAAVVGYDLATGLGTPAGASLINALVWPPPTFTNQPAGQSVTNGASVTLAAGASSTTPVKYFWLFNGAPLAAGGNFSGAASNTLFLSAAATNNSGNYQLVASNLTGLVTSSVAVLNVGFPPAVSVAPGSLTELAGSNAVFAATGGGSLPLAYQWKKNGTNFSGAGIAGVSSNVLSLAGVTTGSAASYSVVVTNLFGSITSSAAVLTVVLPPTITSSSLTNWTVQCHSNNVAFAVTCTGTPPLSYQWSLDAVPVAGATNASFSISNLGLPNHAVSVTVTNPYASATSNATVTVQDTLPPTLTLNGPNPYTVQWGGVYVEPGATATDLCAGNVPVSISGAPNPNIVGTYVVTYTAADGNGNTSSATRSVMVQDTNPPSIVWSFTNLTLAADTNCVATMPEVTGTNFIQATDLALPLTVAQTPTNSSVLPLGTNTVVLTVTDAYGNSACSTNQIVVQDLTPPVISLNGPNPMTIQLGGAFVDPGAAASDACSGIALWLTNGAVNVNAVGTYPLAYIAVDGSGNTNTATRTVMVVDTVPPTILWSFTNLTLGADADCVAAMPDVTGTNFIQATDLALPLVMSQDPTNGAILTLGTNDVVLTVTDLYGNTAYSTNQIVVQDQTPPVMVSQPQSQAGVISAGASFGVAATACTPLAFQWFFNGAPLPAQTGATLALSDLSPAAAGNYSVVVSAAGGSSTSAVATLTVNLIAASVTLSSSENPSGFQDLLNFTAVVTPAGASGTVLFLTNGTAFDAEPLLFGSAASAGLAALPRGTNVVSAIYSGDPFDSPAAGALAQIVTNHPPVGAPIAFTNTADAVLVILITNLAAGWSDADGDAVSLAGVSVSTNGVTLTNTGTALIYFNPDNVPDEFTCTITDGWGGTNFQMVTILPAPAVAAPEVLGVAVAGNGVVTLRLGGAPGGTYVLETSPDLSGPGNWQPLATNTLDSSGLWQFEDLGAANVPARFFRLMLAAPPP